MHPSTLKTRSFSALLLGVSLASASTVVFSKDIMQVYSDAAANSLRFKSASVDYQIATEKKNEIAAEYDPQLNLRVTPGYLFSSRSSYKNQSRTVRDASDVVDIDYSLDLSKSVYDKELDARISQAGLMLEKEEALLDSQRQALIARVASHYFDFLIAQNNLNFSLQEQRAIQQKLAHLNTLFRSQRATITDVKETESRLDQARSRTTNARNELDDARKKLGIMTGITYQNLKTLDTRRQYVKLEPGHINGWINLARNNSHEIVAARREQAIQHKNIAIHRAGKSAKVDLFARYEGTNTVGGSSDGYSDRDGRVGFEINIPLYTGDRISSRVRGANLRSDKARYDLELVEREMTQQVRFAFQSVMSDKENIQTLQKAVKSAEQALRSVRQGKLAGTRTMTDVLASLRESYEVKRSYNNVRYKYLLDIINLKQAAGILSVDDLRLINSLLGSSAVHHATYATSPSRVNPQTRKTIKTLEDAWNM